CVGVFGNDNRAGIWLTALLHAEFARSVCNRRAMVAGTERDHAAGARVSLEREQRVERAADFERSGLLQVLWLQEHAPAVALKRFSAQQRRGEDVRLDALLGGAEIVA